MSLKDIIQTGLHCIVRRYLKHATQRLIIQDTGSNEMGGINVNRKMGQHCASSLETEVNMQIRSTDIKGTCSI